MRGLINDGLRFCISVMILVLGRLLEGVEQFRIVRFVRNQKRLKHRYGISATTPIIAFDSRLEESIALAAKRLSGRAIYAHTSGSTGKPKRLLYSKQRLRMLRFQFVDVFARVCRSIGIRRTSLYVFSSFEKDESVTDLLTCESRLPGYFSTLQAPYRVQGDTSIRELLEEYGVVAVRLWVIAIANPGVLYSTNPSTISTFLDELTNNWNRSRKLIKDWYERPLTFNRQLSRVARRIESRGSKERLAKVALSTDSLPLKQIAPAVGTYICWTGGYVMPFLERLDEQLPSSLYRRVPMYSMSTEVVETVTSCRNGETKYLPLGYRVLYEFVKEGDEDLPQNLVEPSDLVAGEYYTMITSDGFGLRRYQTNDLFYCREIVDGLPSLEFVRRRGLEYSFTGEKLTAPQLCEAYGDLRADYPEEFAGTFFTCFPCMSKAEPHYLIVAVGEAQSVRDYADWCDTRLGQLNFEYRNKRMTGRLGKVGFRRMSVGEFCSMFPTHEARWDSQFKVLPLYRQVITDEINFRVDTTRFGGVESQFLATRSPNIFA